MTGYEKHIIQCPLCGKDVLDHMTECPSCKARLEPMDYRPMDSKKTRKIRMIITLIILAGTAVYLLIKYLK